MENLEAFTLSGFSNIDRSDLFLMCCAQQAAPFTHLLNMKHDISVILMSIAIALGSHLIWRMWQPNLTGHWDIVEGQLDDHYSAHDWIYALDITGDNIAYLNYDPENPSPASGTVNRLFRTMDIGPSCLSLNISYRPDGNTLHLELPNYENPLKPYQMTAVRSLKCPHSWKPKY